MALSTLVASPSGYGERNQAGATAVVTAGRSKTRASETDREQDIGCVGTAQTNCSDLQEKGTMTQHTRKQQHKQDSTPTEQASAVHLPSLATSCRPHSHPCTLLASQSFSLPGRATAVSPTPTTKPSRGSSHGGTVLAQPTLKGPPWL